MKVYLGCYNKCAIIRMIFEMIIACYYNFVLEQAKNMVGAKNNYNF